MADLTRDNIDEKFRSSITTQDYSSKQKIEGVKVVELKNFVGLDGDLSELLKLDGQGNVEGFEGFSIKQINRSKMIPNTVKAWHLHLKQDELWYIPPSDRLLLALWDVRKDSQTNGVSMKIVMGAGTSRAVFIPRGVAHGAANHSQNDSEVYYFISEQFDINNPDENRLPWDSLGSDFWNLPKE